MSELNGNGNGRQWQWSKQVGPASILAMVQLGAIIIGGVYTFATLQNTAQNTKDTTDILRGVVQRQEARTSDLNDRMIRVETVVTGQSSTLAIINQKIDGLRR